jgi:hypothetical protein
MHNLQVADPLEELVETYIGLGSPILTIYTVKYKSNACSYIERAEYA